MHLYSSFYLIRWITISELSGVISKIDLVDYQCPDDLT